MTKEQKELLQRCPVCFTPQPPTKYMATMHKEWCPRHNKATCLVCRELAYTDERQ